MSRKPFFRNHDGWWYAQINLGSKRKQVKLVQGKANQKEAYRIFCRLMAEEGIIETAVTKQSVATICDLFLEHSQRLHKPTTFEWHKRYLQSFCDRHGKLMVGDLKIFHVSRWLDAHPSWKGSRWHAISIVKRAFAWGELQGYITVNPIRKMKKPTGGKRTRVLTAEERQQILLTISDDAFREFVMAMQETGCRPSEVSCVTASHVDLARGVWIFQQHKTSHKTNKPRVVYLSPKMLAMSRQLCERHPSGPLFRGRDGKPFNNNSIRCRFRRLREKLPELKHFSAYSFRHTYCTDALEKGVGVAQVAELLGHTSTDMVMRHYQHLSQKVEYMRQAAAQVVSS